MTIPVYYGGDRIGEFFDTDGMIILKENDLDHIEDVLKKCTKEFYQERIPILKSNFQKALAYKDPFQMCYEKYMGD